MQEQFKRQAEQFINAAKDGRIPENMQTFAREGVAKTREAYDKLSTVAKDHAKTTEELLLATHAGAKTIGAKLMDNTAANAEAVFDAAHAIATARSIPEAARIQAEFLQKQFAIAGAQTKELLELSARIAQQTLETVNTAATKSFEQARKVV
jgi:hypothetical protein